MAKHYMVIWLTWPGPRDGKAEREKYKHWGKKSMLLKWFCKKEVPGGEGSLQKLLQCLLILRISLCLLQLPGRWLQILVPSHHQHSCLLLSLHVDSLWKTGNVNKHDIPSQNPWKGQGSENKLKGGHRNGQGNQCLTIWIFNHNLWQSDGCLGVHKVASKARCPLLTVILESGGIKTLRGLLVYFAHCTHEKTEAQKGEAIQI